MSEELIEHEEVPSDEAATQRREELLAALEDPDTGDESPTKPDTDDEQTTDDDGGDPSIAPAESSQVEPERKTAQEWDKELQRIQQARAAYEREVERMRQHATPQQQQRVEKAASRLDELLDKKDDEIDPYASTRVIAEEVKRVDQRAAVHDQQYQSLNSTLAEVQDRIFELDFKASNPDMAARYADMRSALNERMVAYSHRVGPVPDSVWGERVALEWDRILNEERSRKPSATQAAAPDVAVDKPKATQVITTKSAKRPPGEAKSAAREQLLSALEEYSP